MNVSGVWVERGSGIRGEVGVRVGETVETSFSIATTVGKRLAISVGIGVLVGAINAVSVSIARAVAVITLGGDVGGACGSLSHPINKSPTKIQRKACTRNLEIATCTMLAKAPHANKHARHNRP